MEDVLDLALDTDLGENLEDSSSDTTSGAGDGTQQDGTDQTAGDTTTTDDAAADANAPIIKDGKLSPAAKAHIEELKVKNPALAKTIQRALFAEDRLRRELPGGFKDLQNLRQSIETLGGENGIKDLQAENTGWREWDKQYTAGDPKALDFLTQTPEASAAFLKIAPMAFDRFRESSPDGYNSYVSSVFVSDMVSSGVPLALERIQDHIGDNPKALAALKPIIDYVNRIGEMARKQPAAASTTPKAADTRSQEYDKRDSDLRGKEWGGETATLHNSLYRDAMAKHLGGRTLTPAQNSALVKLYKSNLSDMLAAKKEWKPNIDRYFGAKDKAGYLRFFQSNYTELVPRALRQSIAELGIGGKPGPKPGEAKPGQKAAAVNSKPDEGFKLVNAKPNFMNDVNRNLTTATMFQQKKAVLKNGTRVQWQ